MSYVPMIPASALRPILACLDRIGCPHSPRMARVAACVDDPAHIVPYSVALGVYEDGLRGGVGEHIGLRAGESAALQDIGPFGDRLRRASTVAAALDLAVRQRHNTGQRFTVLRRGPMVWLQRHVATAIRTCRLQERDTSLAVMLRLLRLAAGPRWRPTELHLEGPPPAHAEQLAGLAERAVRFGAARTVVVFPTHVLALPMPRLAENAGALDGDPPVAPQDFAAAAELGDTDSANFTRAFRRWAGVPPRSYRRALAEHAPVH